MRKLTEFLVRKIWDYHIVHGLTQREIAAIVGVHRTTVTRVLGGKSWRGVPLPETAPDVEYNPWGTLSDGKLRMSRRNGAQNA
jgi:transcriptional regulator with XRE-family HTH domain